MTTFIQPYQPRDVNNFAPLFGLSLYYQTDPRAVTEAANNGRSANTEVIQLTVRPSSSDPAEDIRPPLILGKPYFYRTRQNRIYRTGGKFRVSQYS